jgi:hypothetical protein
MVNVQRSGRRAYNSADLAGVGVPLANLTAQRRAKGFGITDIEALATGYFRQTVGAVDVIVAAKDEALGLADWGAATGARNGDCVVVAILLTLATTGAFHIVAHACQVAKELLGVFETIGLIGKFCSTRSTRDDGALLWLQA